MRPIVILTLGFLFPLLASAPAQAQATRTWVSGVGDDLAACSRTAPCKTFAAALANTTDNGEINCVDPGGFGEVTITKNITIDCGGTLGSILATGVNGITVSAGSAVLHVILRNLSINGGGACGSPAPGCLPASPGLNGIRFLVSGSLTLDNVTIQNFTAGGTAGNGIDFAPINNSQLIVSNSYFYNNGNGSTGGGIRIRPTGGAVTAIIDRSVISRGTYGVSADTTVGSTGINLTIRQSAISDNNHSNIIAAAGGNGSAIMVDHSSATNGSIGLHAAGPGAVIRVLNSSITGNGTATSGNVLSYGNNAINGNGVDTIPGPIPGGLH